MHPADSPTSSSYVASWMSCAEMALSSQSLVGVKQALDEALGKSTDALYNLFESASIDKVTDTVCCYLLSLYRTKDPELCKCTMELVPSMIWAYLFAVSTNMKKGAAGIEACLLALYNLEVVDEKGRPKVTITTIPSLGRPSIYHEPSNLGSSILTESALSRYEQDDRKVFTGPFPVIDKCNAKNRLSVLSHLLRSYNGVIGQLSSRSHHSLCEVAIRVSCAGFYTSMTPADTHGSPCTASPSSPVDPMDDSSARAPAAMHRVSSFGARTAVSSELLVELARGVYFALFNYDPALGLDALRCVNFRATFELYADAIMITRAMINSVESSLSGMMAPAGQRGPCDVSTAMGVSLLLTPSLNGGCGTANKEVITNASFRSQKLPDDIGVESEEPEVPSGNGAVLLTPATPLSEKKALGLSGLKFGPLKSALKKVERSITVRKDEPGAKKEDKDPNTNVKDSKERSDSKGTKRAHIAVTLKVSDHEQKDCNTDVLASGIQMSGMASNDSVPSSRKQEGIPISQLPLVGSRGTGGTDIVDEQERADAVDVDSVHVLVSWDEEDRWEEATESMPGLMLLPMREINVKEGVN